MRRIAYRVLVILLIHSFLSCTLIRQNNEDFYYDYAFKVMREGIDSRVREKCRFTSDIEDPTFTNAPQTDLDLLYKEQHLPYKVGGFYSETQRKIIYSKYSPELISHEVIHHLDNSQYISRECLVEYLAEMVQYAVEQDMQTMHLQNRLQRGR